MCCLEQARRPGPEYLRQSIWTHRENVVRLSCAALCCCLSSFSDTSTGIIILSLLHIERTSRICICVANASIVSARISNLPISQKTFPKHFDLPRRYPYEWRSPVVYFLNLIVLFIQFHYMFMIYVMFSCLFFGSCVFFTALAADLKLTLTALENGIQLYAKQKGNTKLRARQALQGELREFTALHSQVKQLSGFAFISADSSWKILFLKCDSLAAICNSLYKPMLVVFFYGSGMFWCLCLLDLNMVIESEFRHNSLTICRIRESFAYIFHSLLRQRILH